MIIQINTDKTINGAQNKQDYFTSFIEEKLKIYQSHITRVEVHLKDENGKKDGFNDISCIVEARLKNKKPIAVNNLANTFELSLMGAINKMKAALKPVVEKIGHR